MWCFAEICGFIPLPFLWKCIRKEKTFLLNALFSVRTDDVLLQIKKNKQTACSFGISAPPLQFCQSPLQSPLQTVTKP